MNYRARWVGIIFLNKTMTPLSAFWCKDMTEIQASGVQMVDIPMFLYNYSIISKNSASVISSKRVTLLSTPLLNKLLHSHKNTFKFYFSTQLNFVVELSHHF